MRGKEGEGEVSGGEGQALRPALCRPALPRPALERKGVLETWTEGDARPEGGGRTTSMRGKKDEEEVVREERGKFDEQRAGGESGDGVQHACDVPVVFVILVCLLMGVI